MSWYYAVGGEQKGPVEEEELRALRSGGDIADDTLVWKEGMGEWQSFAEVIGAPSAATAGDGGGGEGGGGTETCAYSGVTMPRSEMIRYGDAFVAPEHKEAFVQRLKEGGDADPAQLQYAGFWIRFAAKLIDNIITGVAFCIVLIIFMIPVFSGGGLSGEELTPLMMIMIMLGYASGFGIVVFYTTWMVGKWGATLGKMAVGVKIVNPDGSSLSYLKAFARFWGEAVSGMTMAIGYIIAAFDDERRALHDHICATRVVMK